MKKKRLLVVSYNMIVGGSTTSLLSFLKAIDKKKIEVDLLLYKNEGPLFDMIPIDVNVLEQAFKYEGDYGKIIKFILGIFSGYLLRARLENKKMGKLGYSNQIMSDFQVCCLSKKIKKQYDFAIGYLEGWADRYVAYKVNAKRKYGWLHSTFDKIAPNPMLEVQWMDKMDKIVCVAESCRQDFCEIMKPMNFKSVTIENMIDKEFLVSQSKIEKSDDLELKDIKNYVCFKIVSVCRLSIETKGLDRVILTAKKLVDDGMKFKWYIVGDGADKERLKKMIRDNGLQEVVILTGNRINPYPFLAEADIMCMPSRWEGKPMTVLEALAVGTPCIVTEYLSAKEQIENGLEGIIVENTDDSIYPAIKSCIIDKTIVEKMRRYIQKKEYSNKEHLQTIERELFYN